MKVSAAERPVVGVRIALGVIAKTCVHLDDIFSVSVNDI